MILKSNYGKMGKRDIMDANWDLLKDLIINNREHGDKTDEEIIEIFLKGYESLNRYKNEKGEIDVEYALKKIDSLINS